jgi:hypothetical protein
MYMTTHMAEKDVYWWSWNAWTVVSCSNGYRITEKEPSLKDKQQRYVFISLLLSPLGHRPSLLTGT